MPALRKYPSLGREVGVIPCSRPSQSRVLVIVLANGVSGPARAYHLAMAHLSDWHKFDPSNRKTYPTVDAPVQVKFDDGKFEEGGSRMFFPFAQLLPCSSINAWRYVSGVAQH
jgi:hypothetical protein